MHVLYVNTNSFAYQYRNKLCRISSRRQ